MPPSSGTLLLVFVPATPVAVSTMSAVQVKVGLQRLMTMRILRSFFGSTTSKLAASIILPAVQRAPTDARTVAQSVVSRNKNNLISVAGNLAQIVLTAMRSQYYRHPVSWLGACFILSVK